MHGSGTGIFDSPDAYQARLPGTGTLLVLQPAQFQARLTWLELPRVHLLRAHENVPRIRFVTLPADRVFVVFPLHRCSTLTCGGIDIRRGEFLFHALGASLHERIGTPCVWGLVSLSLETLLVSSRALLGRELGPPPGSLILRPAPADRLRLLRLLTQAARIAETRLAHIGHPEVVRSLEQDLISALITGLNARRRTVPSSEQELHRALMAHLETILAGNADRVPGEAEICDLLGVSQELLRVCCLNALGMCPQRYLHLRRLVLARTAVECSNPSARKIQELMRSHGFAGFNDFVTEYDRAFGEPSFARPRNSHGS
jgi:methylphosphotriester-DNA--protein-cysteine methyltransferase